MLYRKEGGLPCDPIASPQLPSMFVALFFMCIFTSTVCFQYSPVPHVTAPVYTPLLVSLFTDEGSCSAANV